MNGPTLIRVLSGLLLANAVLHVIVAVFGAPEALKMPLIAFGLIYGALGLWVQRGERLAVTATALLTLVGLTLGGMKYLGEGGPISMVAMFLIDAAVLAAGALYLLKGKPAS